jgi:hypothetical protein
MSGPYVSYHGIILNYQNTRLVDIDGVSESGGKRKTDNYSGMGRDFAGVLEAGREPVTYAFDMFSEDRGSIDEAVAVINSGPEDAEFYPREEDRCVYAAYGSASRPKAEQLAGMDYLYRADAEIIARDSKQYGPEQGIPFQRDVPLPKSTGTLTNAGYYDNTIDFLYASGYFDAVKGLTRNLKLSMNGQNIMLCNQMMAGDCFKLDRFGRVVHSYKTDFPGTLTSLQNEIGSTFIDEGDTAGSMARNAWSITNNARAMLPFYGPLPAQSSPLFEVTLTAITGSPTVNYAFATDLSDIRTLDVNLTLGKNEIYIPNCEGVGFVAFGITTSSSSACTISSLRGVVKRYISPEALPMVNVGDSFTIAVSDESSNNMLSALHVTYRDSF